MLAEDYTETPGVVDQIKGVALGLVAIGVMLAMQYSAAMTMRSKLEIYLNSNDTAAAGVADGVLTNMVGMMLTAVVVFGAVFVATYLSKSLLAGAITGAIAYMGYSVTHIVTAGKLVEYKELMTVASPARVMSDGILLVLIPAAAAAYLAAMLVAKKAAEAWGKAQARQAAIELEERVRKAREAKAAAEAALAAGVPLPVSTTAPGGVAPGPAQVAEPTQPTRPVAPVSSYTVCTTCGASNGVERLACFECGTALAPS